MKLVIYDGEIPSKQKDMPEKISKLREDVKVFSLDELLKIGQEHPSEPVAPKADDTACIMYTCVLPSFLFKSKTLTWWLRSGSMGKPKGVILTHRNLVGSGELCCIPGS